MGPRESGVVTQRVFRDDLFVEFDTESWLGRDLDMAVRYQGVVSDEQVVPLVDL